MIYVNPRSPCKSIREKMKIFEPHHDDWVASDSSLEVTKSEMISSNTRTTEEGLILPKKLVNPCLESSNRQSLHRELLFNQKIGKNVLNQKTELQRALEKQKERHVIAAQNEINKDCTSSLHGELGKVIMERAQKKTSKDDQNTCSDDQNNSEFLNEEYLKARQRLRASKYT